MVGLGLRGLRTSCAAAPPTTLRSWTQCATHRHYSTRFGKTKKKKLELLEREAQACDRELATVRILSV